MRDTVLIFSSVNIEGTAVFNQTRGHFSVHPYVAPYQLSEHNYPQVNMQVTNDCGKVLKWCSSVWLFQKLLCEKLEEQLQDLDVALKKKERAERRYCDMCVNILLGNLMAELFYNIDRCVCLKWDWQTITCGPPLACFLFLYCPLTKDVCIVFKWLEKKDQP